MKTSNIMNVLDSAYNARKNGSKYFNILLEGDSGLGKSSIVQAWAKLNDMQLIDVRAALLERPDILGFPYHEDINGVERTKYAVPEWLPTTGKGVLFLDEINRAPVSVQNIFMKLLTRDTFENGYKLPDDWMIVSAINPDSESYNVNSMDGALLARFVKFKVNYDRDGFLDYMKANNFDRSIIRYIDSIFVYKSPDMLDDNEQYVSNRNIEQLNEFMVSNKERGVAFNLVCDAVLGHLSGEFISFYNKDVPLLYKDFIENEYDALKELLKMSKDVKDFRGDKISVTLNDIKDNFDSMREELFVRILNSLSAGHAVAFFKDYMIYKDFDENNIINFIDKNKLKKVLKKGA